MNDLSKVNKLTLIGMGLINSSLARALQVNNFAREVIGTSRSSSTRNRVRELKIVDEVVDDYKLAVNDADLIIVGIPVSSYFNVFKEIGPHLKKGSIVTDVGSVKKSTIKDVMSVIPNNVSFIPGHPIAGTENSGPDSGFAELFKDGLCILTPFLDSHKPSVDIVSEMWRGVGMKVDIMTADHHDIVLAITSHIPHMIAYSIVGTVSSLEERLKKEVTKYAASGFKDFTRIAASDPIMWRDIMLKNKTAILEMLNLFKSDLSILEKAIKDENEDFMEKLFTKTRIIRKEIIKKS